MSLPVFRRFTMIVNKYLNPGPATPPFTHVCQIGDPVLRQKSVNIPEENLQEPFVKGICKRMKDIVVKYDLLGVAACQIGVPLRIIAISLPKEYVKEENQQSKMAFKIEALPLTVILNPVMKVTDYDQLLQTEQCASVKGYSAAVPRYAGVNLTGFTDQGAPYTLAARGMLARIIQHEMDHLDGRLYIDSMDSKTFQNDGWQRINAMAGNVYIHFMHEKK